MTSFVLLIKRVFHRLQICPYIFPNDLTIGVSPGGPGGWLPPTDPSTVDGADFSRRSEGDQPVES